MIYSKHLKELSALSTPYYFYDIDLLKSTLKTVKDEAGKYSFKVHYAVKANNNVRILKLIKDYGLGADCVSGNEVEMAIKCGFNNNDIILAGAGKTDLEIETALSNKISCLNCESLEELLVISKLAIKHNCVARIALRVNPNIDAQTHSYITTGLNENKFGISENELSEAIEIIETSPSIKLCGLHVHIGSQIHDTNVFVELCKKINSLNNWFSEKKIKFEHINVGGGLGINYENPDSNLIPDFATYFSIFNTHLHLKNGEELQVELGRSIVGQCGTLVSRVLFSKKRSQSTFLILDAGMTELMRPALYQAYHCIQRLDDSNNNALKNSYTVVGPICESSDTFGKNIELPLTKRGDILLIRSVGAYGEVMSSSYNLREKAPAYFLENEKII